MKNKLLFFFLFALVVIGFASCKKSWQCTCQANVVPSGTVVMRTYTINNSYKINAQGDCDADCKQFFNGTLDTNQTATVRPL